MSIDAALSIARSGLLHTQRALSNAADNVANAESEGYTRKRIVGEAVSSGGQGMGVRSLGPMREVDTALVNEMNKRKSELSAAELRQTVLSLIDEAHGDPAKSEGLGIALVEAIDSDDPTALIGLPLIRTCRMLRAAGLVLP